LKVILDGTPAELNNDLDYVQSEQLRSFSVVKDGKNKLNRSQPNRSYAVMDKLNTVDPQKKPGRLSSDYVEENMKGEEERTAQMKKPPKRKEPSLMMINNMGPVNDDYDDYAEPGVVQEPHKKRVLPEIETPEPPKGTSLKHLLFNDNKELQMRQFKS